MRYLQFHNDRILGLFEKHDICEGVRWEIAMLVQRRELKAEDISETQIVLLKGSNEKATPRVEPLLTGKVEHSPAKLRSAYAQERAARVGQRNFAFTCLITYDCSARGLTLTWNSNALRRNASA